MEILLWLAAPLAVTAVAMLWAGWRGRRPSARTLRASDERAQERFSRAMSRRPRKPLLVATQHRERPSGVAVRPSSRTRSLR
ncbi:hypothetical protein MU582_16280 [Nocardioidaceae bacterium SCSIO 66511]|nr:hypothetical protein MU582_16280 [Nocardioidaceae bacterium SCSIO 66511]